MKSHSLFLAQRKKNGLPTTIKFELKNKKDDQFQFIETKLVRYLTDYLLLVCFSSKESIGDNHCFQNFKEKNKQQTPMHTIRAEKKLVDM